MKKIDTLLIKSFVAPFVATFFIAMFVLIMQFLWTYIDDIIGKGVGLLIISELLFYLSMSLIPTALPIAILISSVMVLGNLAEHYELSSFKSAGVPLLRVMKPLIFLTIGVAGFSYFCSNNLIPFTNLKFKSRLYDIRKSKPTLSLEQGIFNEDFKGFVIHIGKKEPDDRTIRDVIIYNHDYKNMNRVSIITAKRGEMYNSEDKNFFVMNLYDGIQYQEPQTTAGSDKKMPFVRTYFKEWNKVFDLSQFELQNTDEDRFKNNATMLTTSQLYEAIDSIDRKIDKRISTMGTHFKRHFQPTKAIVDAKASADRKLAAEMIKKLNVSPTKKQDKNKNKPKTNKPDTKTKSNKPLKANKKSTDKPKSKDKKNVKSKTKAKPKPKVNNKPKNKTKINPPKKPSAPKPKKKPLPIQKKIDKPLTEYNSFLETIETSKHSRILNKAKSFTRGIRDQAQGAITSVHHTKQQRVKHVLELNMKFSMAVVCIIFLFIGGPMGAIIRKGGFGYPILVAIFFFVIFMILNIFCKKLAETLVLPAHLAPWIPCFILFPVGMILTTRAMNDSKMINLDRYQKIFAFIKRMVTRKNVSS